MCAILIAIVHGFLAKPVIDGITVGLLIISVLPWLSVFITSAEFPGGWKFEFRAIQERQDKQQNDIESLKFLISYFLTPDELTQLNKLKDGKTFDFVKRTPFQNQLRRLRDLGLIENMPDKIVSITDLPEFGDLSTMFRITDRGRQYLALREKIGV
jgi:hypothetical protein